jgi:hypothetical protein
MKTINLRASSISTLMDCPARWKATHLDGMTRPSSSAAHLGTSIHASTAVFDQARIDHLDLKASEAAGVFVDTLLDKNADVDWTDSELTKREAQIIGLTLHTKYCAEISPTQQFVAVEETMPDLAIHFPEQDVSIVLTGHIDRIYRGEDGLGIGDLKSGKGAVRVVDGKVVVPTATHMVQLGAYELLTEAAINDTLTAPAAIYGMGTGADRVVGIGHVDSPKKLLLGDGDDQGLLEIVAKMFANELFYGNPRSQLCSERYCAAFATCKWRKSA